MSVRKLINGGNIVTVLFFLLVYLIVSSLQTNDSTLSKLIKPQPTLTPTVAVEENDEDVIEEHEPEEDASQSSDVAGVTTERQPAQVIKVVDGDTVSVRVNGRQETIRVIGLDTPETVDPRRGVQCFGKEASNHAKQVLTGETVYLEADPTQAERDRYQRLLRYVFMRGGTTDFGKYMIQEGYGNEYTYERPYKYQLEYKQAQQEARTNKKGLWADNVC